MEYVDTTIRSRITTLLKSFKRDERGDIAIMFGMLAVTMMMFVGSAVDISRWLSARTTTLSAVDAAVLAGARALQTGNKETAAVAAAEEYYSNNVAMRVPVEDTIGFKVGNSGNSMQATGTAYINTPFLSFAGIDKLPLIKVSGAEFAEALVAVGGNSQTNLEVSLMLDITGSMAGSKIADLKDAAKDLIDIIVWEDQSQYTSRVSLVPFSEAIRLKDNIYAEVAPNGQSKYTFTDWWGSQRQWKIDGHCVTERTGANAFTDANPTGQKKMGLFYDSNGSCLPTSGSVIPLSSDKAMLKSEIDGY
ncbi:MAG: pilus assembly protein, partial [Hyphomicrobiaceae bacterium]